MSRLPQFGRSACPVAVTLDLLGDKWTLIVVRDLLGGDRRFNDLVQTAERIPTNILADRLKRLERHGLVGRTAYQERPVRYDYYLTEKGLGLAPVIREICRWANDCIPGTWRSECRRCERVPCSAAVATPDD